MFSDTRTGYDWDEETETGDLWPISSTDANGLVTAYTRNPTYGYVAVETVDRRTRTGLL